MLPFSANEGIGEQQGCSGNFERICQYLLQSAGNHNRSMTHGIKYRDFGDIKLGKRPQSLGTHVSDKISRSEARCELPEANKNLVTT